VSKKTQSITLSALLSALAVASLYIASISPTGQPGLAAFSSLFVTAAVIEIGLAKAAGVYIVSSALAILLLPDKTAPLLYLLFFGYYPLAKSLIEKVKYAVIRWLLKLIVFNLALSVIWFLFSKLFMSFTFESLGIVIVYLAGNAIFVIFDYGYSKLIWFYINRISKSIKKGT